LSHEPVTTAPCASLRSTQRTAPACEPNTSTPPPPKSCRSTAMSKPPLKKHEGAPPPPPTTSNTAPLWATHASRSPVAAACRLTVASHEDTKSCAGDSHETLLMPSEGGDARNHCFAPPLAAVELAAIAGRFKSLNCDGT
jgi:hypothetical protein